MPNSSADDFFVKMNRQFRRPKPSDEAVAAALQAIQTLAGEVATNESNPSEQGLPVAGAQCPKCGGLNAESNRFCGFCGAVVDRTQKMSIQQTSSTGPPASPTMPGQHLYHHHYHHHYFPASDSPGSQRSQDENASVETSLTEGAGSALRQLVEDWVSQCNAKLFDRLADLYCGEAILVRPDATLLRGRASIRQYLEAAIGAGLRNVQLELTDTRLLGNVACLAGVNRILVPASVREERTGKFLILTRYESPNWRILADVWCMNRDPFPVANHSPSQPSDSVPGPRERRRHSW